MPKETETQSVTWMYPLLQVTEDRRANRVSTEKGMASELVGVDGRLDGGLRPFPGFLKVASLQPEEEENNPWTYNGAAPTSPTHPWRAGDPGTSWTIDEFRSVCFRIGDDGFGYGFVYRVLGGYGGVASIHIQYRNSLTGTTTMYSRQLVEEVDASKPWDVVVYGRLVYIYMQGRDPILFYVRETGGSPAYDEVCVGGIGTTTRTGPGNRPELLDPNLALNIGQLSSYSGGYAGAYSRGQIHHPPYTLSPGSFTGAGTVHGTTIPGDYDTAADLDRACRVLVPGSYAFAYQLLSSKTGLKGPLSLIGQMRPPDFDPFAPGSGETPDSQWQAGTPTVTTTDDIYKYIGIEIAYEKTKYDKAIIFRSARTEGSGGTFTSAILSQEAVINLDEWAVDPAYPTTPAASNVGQSVYWIRLDDKALVLQDTYIERPEFDPRVPPGGVAINYEGCVLVSGIRKGTGDVGENTLALGEIRWSTLTEGSPELFPPTSRYVPNIPSNEVQTFVLVSGNVIGFSRDRMYHIRRESIYIKIQEIHEGYGVIGGRMAATSVGSFAYFLTTKGLKAVNVNGDMDDVRSCDYVVKNLWAGGLEAGNPAFVTYDPYAGAVFVWVRGVDPMITLWLDASRVTELRDIPFMYSDRGVWPTNPLVAASVEADCTERAFFLNCRRSTAAFCADIYVMDATGSKTITSTTNSSLNGLRAIRLLDAGGDSRFVLANQTGSNFDLTGGDAPSDSILGGVMYNLTWGSNFGKTGTITDISGSTITITNSTNFRNGDTVSISPVYMRWVGHPVGIEVNGQDFGGVNFFRLKSISSIGACFSDVDDAYFKQGISATVSGRYKASVYRGNESAPRSFGTPLQTDGTVAQSIKDNEGTYWTSFRDLTSQIQGGSSIAGFMVSPSIEIFCSDLNYNLLGVMAQGSILGTANQSFRSI
jgi:hypothetical protein